MKPGISISLLSTVVLAVSPALANPVHTPTLRPAAATGSSKAWLTASASNETRQIVGFFKGSFLGSSSEVSRDTKSARREHAQSVIDAYLTAKQSERTLDLKWSARLDSLLEASLILKIALRPVDKTEGAESVSSLKSVFQSLKDLGYNDAEIKLVATLMTNTLFSDLGNGLRGPEETHVLLADLASAIPLELPTFYRLQKVFFSAEMVGSDKRGYFFTMTSPAQLVGPSYPQLEQLVQSGAAVEASRIQAQAIKDSTLASRRDRSPEREATALQAFIGKLTEGISGAYATTGYESAAALRADLDASEGTVREVWERLKDGRYQFGMRRTPLARASLLQKGFTSIHESGKSQANMVRIATDSVTASEYAKQREAGEAVYLGLRPADYAVSPDSVKPKYGFLIPENVMKADPSVADYGSDLFIFKKERLKDRTSFSFGDSLDRLVMFDLAWQTKQSIPLKAWDQHMVPWEHNELLPVPLASSGLIIDGQPMNPFRSDTLHFSVSFENPYRALPEMRLSPKLRDLKPSEPNYRASYVELQFWGRLDINDVEAFYFFAEEPSADFLTALKNHGIKVVDARILAQPKVVFAGTVAP